MLRIVLSAALALPSIEIFDLDDPKKSLILVDEFCAVIVEKQDIWKNYRKIEKMIMEKCYND